MRWFNLNTGIIILFIIIILVAIGTGIVGYSLWNVPKAKELFPFLEISEAFPIKAIALFTGLATFGTLLLALATILTIKNNNEREAIRRKDELSKEKRDKDERLLNEIIEWAIDVGKCAFEQKYDTVTGVSTEYFMRVSRANTLSRFNVVNARSEYVTNIASVFEKDLALHSAVKGVTQKLDDIINIIGAVLEGKTTPEKISESEISLYRCVGILTKEAAKIKTRDIG